MIKTAGSILLLAAAGAIVVWTTISAFTAVAANKPFAQCFTSHRMDCE